MKRLAAFILLMTGVALLAGCGSGKPSDTYRSALDAGDTSSETAGGEDQDGALALRDASANAARGEAAAVAARIRLSPVIGAPPRAAEALAGRLQSRSGERGLALVPPGTPGATLDMKGYFSAITESGRTTVIFVWDVFDLSGNRLHRIQGQESAPGSSPDGWSSVNAATMQAIGARTADELSAWLSQQG